MCVRAWCEILENTKDITVVIYGPTRHCKTTKAPRHTTETDHLENSGVSGALLTELSKAFDCLSYKLVISKLQAYGFDKNYFTNRQQRVKVGSTHNNCFYLKG